MLLFNILLETSKEVAKTNILLYNKKTTTKCIYVYKIKSFKYIKC